MAKKTLAEIADAFTKAHEVDFKTVHRRWNVNDEREMYFIAVPGDGNEITGPQFRALVKAWLKKEDIPKTEEQVVDGNEYTVHRNVAFDKKYKINDGEGLMHEDHVNSTVLDSVLTNNRGNTYLPIYKTAGIDGLLVEGNDIRLGDGKQAIASGAAVYVNADRNSGRFPCRRVSILKNTVAGGGILLCGDPSENNVVKGNKAVGGPVPLTLKATVEAADNDGFEVKKG